MAFDDITVDDVIDSFDFMDDWEERYSYLIDLGRQLPPLSEAEMTDLYKVRGCQSQVWLVPALEDGKLILRGDSDAHIVKGLVALMLLVYSGKTPTEVMAVDAVGLLSKLGLKDHLSPMRANGLFSMVERIQTLAKAQA